MSGKKKGFHRIAVWQTAFLGDAVLTLPLIQSIAAAFPQAGIDLYVRGGLKDLFAFHPDLDNVFEFRKRGSERGAKSLLSTASRLSREGYDLFVSPHASIRSGLLGLLSRIPLRIGYSTPAYNRFFYNQVVSRRFTQLEEIERILQLLKPLEIPATSTWPAVHVPPEAEVKAERFFHETRKGPVLGIHPGSVWATKRWPEEYFARTVREALDAGVQVLLFAGPGEEEIVSRILNLSERHHSPGLFTFPANLTLPEIASFIKRLDCYLTNDSGPMHLAWAQNVPTVAVFGPTVRSLGFFPRGDTSLVLETDLPCRPCGLHGAEQCPREHHACMRDITPAMVMAAVFKWLHTDSGERSLPKGKNKTP
ncbi:MAG: glycosyltransferase family 9 protein [Desulfovibrionales bacterium]